MVIEHRFPLFAGLAAGLASGLLAYLFGSTLSALLLTALLGGVAGFAIAELNSESPDAPATAADEVAAPAAADLIAAFDEPVLLVEGRTVAQANSAAEKMLGRHVIGEDIRLAIRHPAAADRLTGPITPDLPPIELVGLGERERRWELIVRPFGADARIVRLADRTGTHAAEQMRVDFVANASHELKTPLATLLGFIETLDDEEVAGDRATVARFVKIMMGEARRMQRLVEDLISLSRIEAEKFRPLQSAVALPDIVEEVRRAVLNGQGEDRILVALADDTPAVPGDRAQLSQLLHNLIGNALKYSRAGSTVRVALTRDGEAMVRLAVEDEGEGIAPEHLPRLTERFYRVDAGRSRALGGTGLGLAIVKHIVERHRGRLEIESVVGKGTTVKVLLPMAAAARDVAA